MTLFPMTPHESAQSCRDIWAEPFLERSHMIRTAKSVREDLEPARLRQRERHRAGEKVVTPEDILGSRTWEGIQQRPDKLAHHAVESLAHQFAAPFRRIIHIGD